MKEDVEKLKVEHNEAMNRFEAEVDGMVAVVEYERSGERIVFTHTVVPPPLEGRGVGSELARAALEHARSEQLAVVPACSFIAAYIRRHPEYQ